MQQIKWHCERRRNDLRIPEHPEKENHTSRGKETPIFFELQHDFECQMIFAWRV